MELRHLRYFAAVAAHGNFSRAAEKLHLTQPALSRQVRDLEDELGVPLLLRGQNYVSLTEAGELFYEDARDLLARADQAMARVRGDKKLETLRVGYSPSLTTGILPRAIERFQNSTPSVRLELADLSAQEMLQQFAAGRLDLAITAAHETAKARGFHWTDIRRILPVLVLPVAHPLARLKRIPPTRLQDLPLLGFDRAEYPEYAPGVRAVLKPFGVTPHFASLSADGLSSLLTALEAQMCGAVLGDTVATLLPATLTMRPFAPALEATRVVAGVPAVRPNPHAEAFVWLLRDDVTTSPRATSSRKR